MWMWQGHKLFRALPRSGSWVVQNQFSTSFSLVLGLLPRKTGREPRRTDQAPCDLLCVVLCVVLIVELLPTQSILSVISGTLVLDLAEMTDQY